MNPSSLSRYEKLGLSFNPFPSPGAAQAIEALRSADIDVRVLQDKTEVERETSFFCEKIRKDEIGWLNDRFVYPLKGLAKKRAFNMWVVGSKGVGKSALLKHVERQLRTDEALLTMLVKLPTKGLTDIYKMGLRWVGSAFFSKLAHICYRAFFSQLSEDIWSKIIADPTKSDLIKKILLETPEIIRLLTFADVEQNIKILNEKGLDTTDANVKTIKKEFSAWLETENQVNHRLAVILSEFLAEPVMQFKNLCNVSKSEMVDVLTCTVQLSSKFLGTRAAIVVVDEIEIPWNDLPTKAKESFTYEIRQIVELSGGRIKIVMTWTMELAEELKTYKHLLDVMPFIPKVNVLDVQPLGLEQAMDLVATYLEKARLPGKEGYINPFTQGAIEIINSMSAGVPRTILMENCWALVEHAADMNYDTIDEKVVYELKPEYKT